MDQHPEASLTNEGDWAQYYSGRQFDLVERLAGMPSLIDEYLKGKPGRIFEMGCGGSHLLARSAMLGWEVGGIDFNNKALALISDYLALRNYENRNILFGDIFSYDYSELEDYYDILVSYGFLEHFTDPHLILSKWKNILAEKGMVISIIPNLYSVNALLMKKFDPVFWSQHIPYSPTDMDQFHTDAGLVPLRKAQYLGHYDILMLIPWSKIQQKINNIIVFKIIKYMAYYGVERLLRILPASNMRRFNSFVMGVYVKE